jgi:hypothetical protein
MQHFQLEHDLDRVTRCDFAACGEVADHLDIDEENREIHACKAHTTSQGHASLLPKRKLGPGFPSLTWRASCQS